MREVEPEGGTPIGFVFEADAPPHRLDEAPGAYKDIRTVIGAQSELIEVLAEFHPRIVRMAGAVEADPEEGN